MQQHIFDVSMFSLKQKLNKSEREEVVPRYIYTSPLYYRKDHENEEFEQRTLNFEPLIRYLVE
jgi:hypothetical protein